MDLDKVNEIATIPVLEKAYDDLVHPSAESIGKTVSLVPRTVAIWLSSWNRWVVNREESIKLAIDAIESRVDKIPEEHLTEPPAHIAVPAIQQLAYCYDSEELRGMYANLLLSSMDDRTAEYVHPSFVQLLKEISPDEAKLLSTLAGSDDAEHASIPLVDLRIVSAVRVFASTLINRWCIWETWIDLASSSVVITMLMMLKLRLKGSNQARLSKMRRRRLSLKMTRNSFSIAGATR